MCALWFKTVVFKLESTRGLQDELYLRENNSNNNNKCIIVYYYFLLSEDSALRVCVCAHICPGTKKFENPCFNKPRWWGPSNEVTNVDEGGKVAGQRPSQMSSLASIGTLKLIGWLIYNKRMLCLAKYKLILRELILAMYNKWNKGQIVEMVWCRKRTQTGTGGGEHLWPSADYRVID